MDSWQQKLSLASPEREESYGELRQILMRGLRAGLQGRAGSDEAFLEDVTQATLIKIVQKLDTFEGRSKFTSWALAIAFRIAYNELNRKDWNHVSLDELREKQNAIPDEADRSPTPYKETERQSLANLLQNTATRDLTPRQRDVLLCELNGMPQEEIARQLNTNRNNVYKLFHDARKALKQALEASGHGKTFFFDEGISETK